MAVTWVIEVQLADGTVKKVSKSSLALAEKDANLYKSQGFQVHRIRKVVSHIGGSRRTA